MPLAPGSQLGRYQILGSLGAGGMGEVYRARDTRLGREVALKVLPDDVAGDPSRLQRFEQEARAVAALNHPNIVALFDVGDRYFITELVEGEPLRGGVGIGRALDIAAQIADGVAAAHRAGIVHRDLKPANILLRTDGRVKILDFGLAKLGIRGTAPAASTETMQTRPGVVVGTAGYMSPEQVRGEEADARSDLFNVGLILYQLLTGKSAFHGDTGVEIMAAILKQKPPDLPESVPPPVRRIVARCLEKNRDDRFQSAADLAFAIRECSAPDASQSRTPHRPSRWRLAAAVLAAAATLATIAVLLFRASRPAPESWSQTRMGGPEVAWRPRLSPDGRTLAMLTLVGSQSQVAIMRPETGDWTVLTRGNDGAALGIAWSPDGSRIYFDRQTGLPAGVYSVPVIGGAPRLVLEKAGNPESLPDGSILAGRFNSSGIFQLCRYWPDTGKLQEYPLEILWENGQSMRAFPGGAEVAVLGWPIPQPAGYSGPRLHVLDLATGQSRPVHDEPLANSTVAVAADGRNVLFAHYGSGVRSVPADGGAPARNLLPLPARIFTIDSAADGSILVDLVERTPQLVLLKDGHSRRLMASAELGPNLHFTVLPDGRAVWLQSIAGRTRLVTVRPGEDPEPLLSIQEPASVPVTELGAGELAFLLGPPARREIGIASVATGRLARRIPFDKGEINAMTASPDGRTLYCVAAHSVWAMPVANGAGPARRLCDGDGVAADPGGKYLAVVFQKDQIAHLYRVPLDGSPPQEVHLQGDWLATRQLGTRALNRDGLLLNGLWNSSSWFYEPGIIDMKSGRVTLIPRDAQGDHYDLNWTPDGQVLAIVSPLRSGIWKFSRSPR